MSLRFNRMCAKLDLLGEFEAKILTVFVPLFSRLFRLLSSIILQSNLLVLYLVEIHRYKLSFFAKHATCRLHVVYLYFYLYDNKVKICWP